MSAAVGEFIKFQSDTGRYHEGRITRVVSGDTVDIVIDSDGVDWPDFGSGTTTWHVPSQCLASIAKGTSVGQWQYSTGFAGAVAANDDDSGLCAVPAAALAPSITIGVDFQATDDTRPARFVISGTWSQALSATGSIAGTVQLKAGPSANPSTVVDDQQLGLSATLLLGVALTPTLPWKLDYELPAGHTGRVVVAAGTGFAITHVSEQAR